MKAPFSHLPRRQRFLALAVAGATAFAVAAGTIVWWLTGDDEVYRPGQPIEGLSSVLERGVPEDAPSITFTDVSEEAGITAPHFPGARTSRLPEDMGSGAAWADYDDDGWLDLYVVSQSGPLDLTPAEVAASPAHGTLYRNRGDGTFEDVSEAAGVDFRGTGMAAAWADYDRDGDPDLLVTAYGPLVLYRNRGDGTFEDVTAETGLGGLDGFWAGVSWADYDRDGDLDAYVTGYVDYQDPDDQRAVLQYDVEQPASLNPSAFPPARNLLLRNDDGAFTDVAESAGVADPEGRSLSAAWIDLDGDGWPDLYVADDVSDNRLFHNRGDGTFEDVSHAALVADYRGSMGIAVGDWDRDGDPDLFLTHWIAQENALYMNLSGGAGRVGPTSLRFMDVADRYGLGQVALDYVGWGTSFFDYDNDGHLDLLVVNGSTLQEPDAADRLVPMRDLLLWNGGGARGFFDVSSLAGPYFERRHVGRGAAFGDYDNDGDVDVVIVNHGARPALLRNDAPDGRAWLQVDLRGRDGPALGARVRVVVDSVRHVRFVGAQSSYLSQNSPIQHFGLGDAGQVDTLEVRWPSGASQVFTGLPVGRRVRLVEGGEPVLVTPAGATGGAGSAAPTDAPRWTSSSGAVTPAGAAASAADRDRVREFWTRFREATTHRVAGRLDSAVMSYRRARTLDPDHEDTLYYLGSVLLDLGRFDEARDALERLVRVNPASARGHGRLGMLHMCGDGPAADRLAAAEAAYRESAALNREATGAYLRLAEAALARRDLDGAARALEIVLGSDPDSAPAHFLRGYIAWREGRADDAEYAFRRALDAGGAGDGLVSGEGDTSEGAALVAEAGDCPVPLTDPADLMGPGADGDADGSLRALMGERYGAVDRRISRLRTGSPAS